MAIFDLKEIGYQRTAFSVKWMLASASRDRMSVRTRQRLGETPLSPRKLGRRRITVGLEVMYGFDELGAGSTRR